eukprot:TRINITY_DN6702_c0_g4_i1.p1 TRINITY_DN6702_c0_g4~~TRINITY_DN6702_c0_g4_i1.p1  ORF type:complete len:308 (+),score=86.31 TRINITY_DN6702_c0_g4_i1:47-970(+)
MAENKIINYKIVEKRINSPVLLETFLQSKVCEDFVNFLTQLNDSVTSKPISFPCTISQNVSKIIELLDKFDEWINEIPPLEQPMRYGNRAFRTWFDRIKENSQQLLGNIFVSLNNSIGAEIEITQYLIDSVGNPTRIDYGTGHETNFAAFLYCLYKIGFFQISDFNALVLRLFVRYLNLIRKVQLTYYLEPAGSHGVWSLDDYQFLPFYWGAAQLIGHKDIVPSSIHQAAIVEQYANEYLYLTCIKFIRRMKTGPFREHSPVLTSVSEVIHWEKVNQGMLKMYRGEVLSKFPIMQHFLFGSIIDFQP